MPRQRDGEVTSHAVNGVDGGTEQPLQAADAAAPEAAPAALVPGAPAATRPRSLGLVLEMVLSVAAGASAALWLESDVLIVVLALAVWSLGTFHRGRSVTSPLARQLRAAVNGALFPLALTASAVGFFAVSPEVIPPVFAAVLAATGVSMACRAVRWRVQSPVRVMVAGDRLAVTAAIARWAKVPHIAVVGGMVLEPDLDADQLPASVLGVPIYEGLQDAPERAGEMAADLVVVSPGPGFTASDFRRLARDLERSKVSLGVMGVLDSVAPHRITPGTLDRATVMDVRAPRPSGLVRGVKAGLDRGAALALLLVISPVLLTVMAMVRLDSKGPALFKQTRVGQHGRHFQVYKIRTMIQNADEVKASLAEANEADSVLFKIKHDPRITRLGHALRKYSLDELPQLINVVRGEMSLVGPRPHLPSEIAAMDADTLRRLAVRPGITGLWQVSGRSDLAFDEAAWLDTYYADNWSLGGDAMIGLKTVPAVVRAKGAY